MQHAVQVILYQMSCGSFHISSGNSLLRDLELLCKNSCLLDLPRLWCQFPMVGLIPGFNMCTRYQCTLHIKSNLFNMSLNKLAWMQLVILVSVLVAAAAQLQLPPCAFYRPKKYVNG